MGFIPRHQPSKVTGWHPGFAQLVSERGPASFRVYSEVQLSRQPRRADLLLVRRIDERHDGRPAKTLRGLWPLIPKVGLVEFKSPSHEFRSGDLLKLASYGLEYLQLHKSELTFARELTLVLVTPSITPTLLSEIDFMECSLAPIGPKGRGYARLADGVCYLPTIIVATNEVAPAENDAYLSVFSHKNMDHPEAAIWFQQWLAQQVNIMGDPARIDDFDAMLRKLYHMLPPDEILRRTGLKPEQVLKSLATEDLARLTDEELEHFKGLINEALRQRSI